MTSIKLNHVGYKIFKIKKLNLKFKFYNTRCYSSTKAFESNIIKLESHSKIYGTISKSSFFNLLRTIESINEINDKNLASLMIKSCSLNFVDLFPSQRQSLLNYLFYDLLPKKNVQYNQQDYEIYMENTLSNRSHFDPYLLSNVLNKKYIFANSKINSFFIHQLCELNDIKVALAHLNNLIKQSNNESFNLETYRSQTNNKTEDEIFDNLMNNLSTIKNDLQETNLFNPIILYYFTKSKDSIKSIELFKLICQLNLKPNNQTYFNLINGYLFSSKYEECDKLFNKVKNDLKLNNLLALNTIILDKMKKDIENKDILNSIKENVLGIISTNFTQQERIVFIDNLFHLCSNNRREDAFNLMEEFFSNEYSENDPVIKDNNDFKLSIVDYFCKSIIEFDAKFEIIKKYSTILDEKTDKFTHFKKMLYYSLNKTDYYLSMSLIDDLNSNDGGPIKFNYFTPIIASAANELETYLSRNTSLLLDSKFKIKNLNQFKVILSVFDKMVNQYKVYLGLDEISTLVKIYKFGENGLKKYLRFSDLIYLRKISPLNLFYSSMYTLLNYRLSSDSRNSLVLDKYSILTDFQDMNALISFSKVNFIEKDLLRRINNYIEFIIEKDLVDLRNGIVALETLNIIAQKCNQNDLTILSNGLNNFKNRLLLLTENNKEKYEEIKNHFDNISNKMIRKDENNHDDKTNTNKEYAKENINTLEILVEELKSKQKNHIAATRRLIIALCNRSYLEGVEKPLEKVENLLKDLSNEDLTPLVCQELAHLYSTNTLKIEKAKYYFNLMIEKSEIIPHTPNKFKLISYLDTLVNNKIGIKQIQQIFEKLSWSTQSNDRDELKDNIKLLLIKLYQNSNPDEFKDLVETMFNSNFIRPNVLYADLVMLKLIEFNKFDDVLDYFKLYLTEHKLSLLEVFVLKLFLSKNGNRLTNEDKHLTELTKLFGNFYNQTISFNSLFIALILNGSFKVAQTIYENNLNKKLELKVLNRCVSQLCSNRFLYKKYSKSLKNNILKFSPLHDNGDEIKTIIKKLDNVKF
jgi:hypothetical protein